MMFPDHVINDFKNHAIGEYPKECCGVVMGNRYHKCNNVADDPLKDFRIDPEQYIVLSSAAKIQAIMHSHPDGPMCPSSGDMIGQLDTAVPWGIGTVSNGVVIDFFWFGDQVPMADLIGRKFKHGVHDCYSLIRDYYKVELDVTLPEFPRDDEWWMKEGNPDDLYRKGFENAGFTEISERDVKKGDVILFSIMPPGWRGPRIVSHGAVYLGNGLMLHHLYSSPERGSQRLSKKEPVGQWMQYKTHVLRYVE